MSKETKKIPSTEDAWDEAGELGNSEAHVKRYEGADDTSEIEAALGLQLISIRLPKSLIEDFKSIGALHGVGYQPLMRQALKRFADAEMRQMLNQAASRARAAKKARAVSSKKDSAPAAPPHKEKLAA